MAYSKQRNVWLNIIIMAMANVILMANDNQCNISCEKYINTNLKYY